MHVCYPQTVSLPGDVQARVRIVHVVETNDKGEQVLTQLVPSPPQYERRDGTTVELDVQIPDDLAVLGWHWFGSTLRHGQTGGPCIAITTDMYPPPPIESERGTCYDCARRFVALHREHSDRQVAERVAKATKAPKPKQASKNEAPESQVRALTQMELF